MFTSGVKIFILHVLYGTLYLSSVILTILFTYFTLIDKIKLLNIIIVKLLFTLSVKIQFN